MRTPQQISNDLTVVLVNALLAVLIALLVFPAVLFNSTLEENYDEIRRWTRRKPQPDVPVTVAKPALRRWLSFSVVAALTAGLAALLDPQIKADRATALLIGGVGVATIVTTVLGHNVKRLYLREVKGRIKSYPGGLLVGAATVGLSRAVNFLPGYLYGIVGGFDSEPKPDKQRAGRAAMLGESFSIALGVAAWIAWQPIAERAAKPGASLATVAADALLAAVAAVTFQSLLFSMIPLKWLPGETLWKWNRAAWAGFMTIGAFSFLHVLARPTEEFTGSVTTLLALFGVFAAISTSFWAFFMTRNRRKAKGAAVGAAAAEPQPAPAPPSATTPTVNGRPRRDRPLRAPGR